MKCRPQDCDAVELAYRLGRVFVGYPAWFQGGTWDRSDVSKSMLDISVPDAEWDPSRLIMQGSYRRGVTINRRYAREIEPGSIVVIPRPRERLCHVGRIAGRFEFVRRPPWAEEYLELRRRQGLDASDEASHVGDVIHSWPVRDLRAVAYAEVPDWIRKGLRQRNQIGRLPDRPDGGQTAYEALDALLPGTRR